MVNAHTFSLSTTTESSEKFSITPLRSRRCTTPLPNPLPLKGERVFREASLPSEIYIAKFAASVYDPRTGKLIVSTDPAYGFSRESDGFLFTWSHNDMGVDMSSDPVKVRDNR